MRTRSIRAQVWLTPEEDSFLQSHAAATGLSRESYLRSLINGYMPKQLPPLDYHTLIRELHSIGNNLNQIAAKANATGHVDTTVFQYEARRLRRAVQEIQEVLTAPDRVSWEEQKEQANLLKH